MQYIQSFHVLGANEVYELLEKSNAKLDGELKQQLLELLCYHSNTEEIDEDFHKATEDMYLDDTNDKFWRPGGLAERLHSDIVTNCGTEDSDKELASRARLALLCGVAKWETVKLTRGKGQKDKSTRVQNLVEECKVNGH